VHDRVIGATSGPHPRPHLATPLGHRARSGRAMVFSRTGLQRCCLRDVLTRLSTRVLCDYFLVNADRGDHAANDVPHHRGRGIQ
jgi:hypothetical protein